MGNNEKDDEKGKVVEIKKVADPGKRSNLIENKDFKDFKAKDLKGSGAFEAITKYLDEKGGCYILNNKEPVRVSWFEWAEWFETADRTVKYEKINKDITVSTVFLGLNQRWSNEGPPILFETMVFGKDFEPKFRRCYGTWFEALKGHNKIVKELINNPCQPI